MANPTQKATLRALIDGVLTDIFAKSHVENIVYSTAADGTETLLSTRLAEIMTELGGKATTASLTSAINALKGENVPEAYNTLRKVADYIATNQTAVTALQNAVNGLGDLAEKDKVSESDLDSALAAKVNAASEGNHSHANKTELDKIATGDKAKWDAAATKADTLVGSDANKSARTIAGEELAKQLIPENAKDSLDTLSEIAAWIQAHPDDAAAMNTAITALQNKLSGISDGTGTVKTYVDGAITALKIGDYAKAADLTALAARVTALEAKGSTWVSSTQPAGLKAGDLWVALT